MNGPSPLLAPGTLVGGDFTVERPLEAGGMGAVFVVLQQSTGKRRALKLMHRELMREASFVRRFEQEARIGARIASEHVVEVVAAGADPALGVPYLVMELLEGEDLRKHLDTRGALPAEETAAILEQLAHGLGAAHAAGIVHRDLKPENVFLARARRAGGPAFTVKLLDFGIARLAAEVATRSTRSSVGSPLWMAPEQTQPGAITAAADVWALGLLAYEMLVGRHFWRAANDTTATTAQLLREVVLDPIPPASVRAAEQGAGARLPAGFDAWFARAVDRDPAARFADATTAHAALAPLLRPGARLALGATVDAASLPPAPPGPRAMTPLHAPSAPPFPVPAQSAPPFASAPPVAPPPHAPPPYFAAAPPAAPPAPSGGRGVGIGLGLGGGIAIAGIAVAFALTRAPATTAANAPDAGSMGIAISTADATPSATAVASTAATPSATASVPSAKAARPTAAPSGKPSASATPSAPATVPTAPRAVPGGFTDPVDVKRAVLWKVQERQVRLFSRLVSNDTNVLDAVVRDAIDHSSWSYLRCYERAFASAKDMPEGVVTVGFDVLDQLPRHAKLVSSTFASDSFNACVVGTVVGQTINAAGPEGRGHAVVAYRFVPN